jgi:hypothetical protein
VVSAGYMGSTIQQDNGVTGWTATMDLQHARMVVVLATPVAFAQGRALSCQAKSQLRWA